MIIQIRGASGSGKSTLVREWVETHKPVGRHMMADAHRWGLGHIDCAAARPFALGVPSLKVIVPGHYDAPGGGCDMIKSVEHIMEVVRKAVEFECHVLMEGLFVSKDMPNTKKVIPELGVPFYVLYLDVPEPDCEESVQQRRESLGRERRPLRAHHADYVQVARRIELLEKEPWATVERHTRESAAARVRELIG